MLQQSIVLADQISRLKPVLLEIDVEFARKSADAMIEQGDLEDSVAVLNPSYDPVKSDALRQAGKTLHQLVDFIDGLKKCDELKTQVRKNATDRSEMNDPFFYKLWPSLHRWRGMK